MSIAFSLEHSHVAVLGRQIHGIELDFHLLRAPRAEHEDRPSREEDQHLQKVAEIHQNDKGDTRQVVV